MDFEHDPAKSKINKTKHGIDFEEARKLWEGGMLELPSSKPGEDRRLVVGKMQNTHWTAVITYRGSRIRIISVRRARKSERKLYENDEKKA